MAAFQPPFTFPVVMLIRWPGIKNQCHGGCLKEHVSALLRVCSGSALTPNSSSLETNPVASMKFSILSQPGFYTTLCKAQKLSAQLALVVAPLGLKA